MGNKTKVLILGTYHFANGGEHKINVEVEDINTDKKQQEINEVLERLAKFNPNKIAVEAKREKASELNEAYLDFSSSNSYSHNQVISHRNEIVQLGFKLGKMLKHPEIYPIDSPVNLPEEVYAYAEKNCPKLYERFMMELNGYGTAINEVMNRGTVLEVLKFFNDPQRIEKEHSNLYLYLSQVGAGDTYYGADMLTEWYRRNLHIFGNLQAVAEPEDRILVIYGAGHCRILQELVEDYTEFELVDALDYL